MNGLGSGTQHTETPLCQACVAAITRRTTRWMRVSTVLIPPTPLYSFVPGFEFLAIWSQHTHVKLCVIGSMLRCGQLTAALLICSGCMLAAKATAGHAHASRGKPAAHRDVSRPSSIIKEEANSFLTPFRSIESPCPAGMEWHPATDTRPRRCMDVDECKDDSSLSTQVSLNDCNGNNFLNTQVRCLYFFLFPFFPPFSSSPF